MQMKSSVKLNLIKWLQMVQKDIKQRWVKKCGAEWPDGLNMRTRIAIS